MTRGQFQHPPTERDQKAPHELSFDLAAGGVEFVPAILFIGALKFGEYSGNEF